MLFKYIRNQLYLFYNVFPKFQAKAEGVPVREIKFHKSEIIKPKADLEHLTNQNISQKPDVEAEVRGRLRSRKDSLSSSPPKPVKKIKIDGSDKQKKEDEKKETSDEDEGGDEEADDGKPKKIKRKNEDQSSNEVSSKQK